VKKEYRRAKSHFVQENARIDPGIIVDPRAVDSLVTAMNDVRFLDAAREATKSLGVLVAQAAVPALIKSAHSPDETLAREALNALAKINDRSAGPQLADLLDSPNKDIKRDAAVTIGILRDRGALPRLQTMFENDPDQKDKEKALEGLAYIGDPVSVPLFTQALRRPDKSLRTSAAEGLARARDPKALSELQKAVGVEKDARARLADEFALSALGRDDYLAAMVHELGSKLYGDVAAAYLVELSRDEKFLPKVYPFLSEQDPSVRKKLCTVLMFSGNQGSLEHLERLSHDSNGEVASEALRATQAIRVRAPALAHKSEGKV
jgi:HEAT repeat protein